MDSTKSTKSAESTESTGSATTDGPTGGRPRRGVTRRALLGTAGAGLVVGAGAGVAGAAALDRSPAAGPAPAGPALGAGRLPFHGEHQAGIVEPQQARIQLAAFDLVGGTGRDGLRTLLQRWSRTAARLAGGEPADEFENQVALDAGPCSLTLTFGFGATLFDKAGLADQRPAALEPLPSFPADALDPARGDGDLFVQICADDALVAVHALRVLQRQAAGTAALRWQSAGFARTPGAATRQITGRNLMGQVDGTNNPKPGEDDFAAKVFCAAGGDQPAWLAGGSYLVFRRIRMLLDNWEALPLDRQERVIGRRKSDGAPLSAAPGSSEFTPADLAAQGPDGSLAIPADAHVRVAAPAANGGAAMLRRGFSYHDGLLADGSPDAGLLFLAFQADPRRGFTPVQRKLSRGDGLSRFLRHEASGLYAVPPGTPQGGYVGQTLLG
ncbi:iron uptake transporter deferrochelatase/peroxidase subunit [Streptomyces sp. CB01881]|uniref:iron uptake transporter deferrochelatase/peroxidase subunit n=1 Tax=Streptomyces sp. CB01881 TaxID=2078691 RepID=UPI000CDCB6AC|nr:iron uptake transporter deferrochelatase/peroxidase subunit [Streptomyces sp. CB01881]AUY54304.1 deferrochelatase/peroxidase EfeB [Streptomyces sp. CB01881]TYC73967.1 deferrochelatase/peroxidase EfeB [Streptomyces sp. CB01881]